LKKEVNSNGPIPLMPANSPSLMARLILSSATIWAISITVRILKNAGIAEDEGALKKELMTLDYLIAKCRNEQERDHLRNKRTEKQVRLDKLTEEKAMFSKPASSHYKEKVYSRLGRP
jgi:hypothetical protein